MLQTFNVLIEQVVDQDAPRAKKDDLVQMSRYLMQRYADQIRAKIRFHHRGKYVSICLKVSG